MKLQKLFVATALVLASAGASAATTTNDLTVSTNVTASCSVKAAALTFTDVDPLANATTATDGTADILVTCSNTTPYDIGLSAGSGSGATVAARKMTIGGGGTEVLNYALYSESTRTTNWGDTVATDTLAGTGDGTEQTHTVYGRIASGQETAKVGAYSDTVTITVTY